MSVAKAMEAGFLLTLDEHQADVHPVRVGVARVPTRSGGITWVVPVYLVISLACQLDDSCPVAARESHRMTL